MRILPLAVAFAVLAQSGPAQSTCRQALALGLDVSGSVDGRECRLQLDGLAAALGTPQVMDALLRAPNTPVRIAVYEWSSPDDDRLVIDWTDITDQTVIHDVQDTLRSTSRALMRPSTGLGEALRVGIALLEQNPDCWVRILDISGDGKANTGEPPQEVRNVPADITVNGLVIGVDDFASANEAELQIGELSAYYTAHVIRGPDAFVETAIGFEDYANAMTRKLLRELTTITVGGLAPIQ